MYELFGHLDMRVHFRIINTAHSYVVSVLMHFGSQVQAARSNSKAESNMQGTYVKLYLSSLLDMLRRLGVLPSAGHPKLADKCTTTHFAPRQAPADTYLVCRSIVLGFIKVLKIFKRGWDERRLCHKARDGVSKSDSAPWI